MKITTKKPIIVDFKPITVGTTLDIADDAAQELIDSGDASAAASVQTKPLSNN